jgi:hypothetical protein
MIFNEIIEVLRRELNPEVAEELLIKIQRYGQLRYEEGLEEIGEPDEGDIEEKMRARAEEWHEAMMEEG